MAEAKNGESGSRIGRLTCHAMVQNAAGRCSTVNSSFLRNGHLASHSTSRPQGFTTFTASVCFVPPLRRCPRPNTCCPLSMTTVLDVPVVLSSMTVAVNGPTEIPNMPMATDKATTGMIKTWSRPPRLPRGPTFRQADYGVSPNVTLDGLAPVQGVEATPSTDAAPPSHSRRSNEDYWESNHLSADDYSYNYNNLAQVDTPQSAPVSESPSLPNGPSDVSEDTDGIDSGDGSTKASGAPLPVNVSSDPTSVSPNHLPVSPNFADVSSAGGQAIAAAGQGRHAVSNAAHQGLGNVFGNSTTHTIPSAADVSHAHTDVQKANQQFGNSIHRRVLRPATFISESAPARHMAQFARDVVQLFSRHQLEFNSEALLPTDPTSLNMSDPVVAHEAARKHNIGLVNLDSNQAHKPVAPHPKVNSPVALNSTQTDVDTAAKNATKVA
ncbi:hypothetical protein C8Q80DRAFT_1185305 [Daedaleopsis nitida]|nr:hypothetical protein C8Q80DRAFT_1185305 [Daedaleopsis nitida]